MSRNAVSTQPTFDAPLPRVSDFQRRLSAQPGVGEAQAGQTRLGALDPSLLQDLQRYDLRQRETPALAVLEVVAAAVRHGRTLRLMLQHGEHVFPLTVCPGEGAVLMPLAQPQWGLLRWSALHVLHVEGAEPLRGAPGSGPLSLLLWALALHGARSELLPEIAGPVAYRIAPGIDLSALDLAGSLGAAVARLKRQTTPLREIEAWPGLDRERASRLLNGLYLQAGLIVSRSHPAAV